MNTGYVNLQDDGLLIDPRKPDAVHHAWPSAYVFLTESPLPSSLLLQVTESLAVQLCLSNAVEDECPPGSWIILVNEAARNEQATQSAPGVLLSMHHLEGSVFVTRYFSPIKALIGIPQDRSHEKGNLDTREPSSSHPVQAKSISLHENPIKIQSGTVY